MLDLDETLVHASFILTPGATITVELEFEGEKSPIYVNVRPHVASFLHRMSRLYEIVVFTASLEEYAKPMLE